MFNKITNTIKETISNTISGYNNLSTAQQVGIILIAAAIVSGITYATVSGIWFLNPFNPTNWTGKALVARIFYGACGGISAFGTYILFSNS